MVWSALGAFSASSYLVALTGLSYDMMYYAKYLKMTTIILIVVVTGNVCDALEEAGISDVFVPNIRG